MEHFWPIQGWTVPPAELAFLIIWFYPAMTLLPELKKRQREEARRAKRRH